MSDIIPTPKMSEILMEEFMEPMGLSAYKLAQEIHVPVSRIQDISMTGERSQPTLPSVWLSFSVSPTGSFWIYRMILR